MLTNSLRRWMLVGCFACVPFMALPSTADAQPEIVISSYGDTWTDLDVTPNEQVFYAEVFDQSDLQGGLYWHSEHYSWATIESTVTSEFDEEEGGGGGPYWLKVLLTDDPEDDFLLLTLMRLLCSGLQDYFVGGPEPMAAHLERYLHWYNWYSHEHWLTQQHIDYSVYEGSENKVCAPEFVAFPYESLTGLTMTGTWAGLYLHVCTRRCSLTKTGTPFGPNAITGGNHPNCTPAVQ